MVIATGFNGDSDRVRRLMMLESAMARRPDAEALANELSRDLEECRVVGLVEPGSTADTEARMAVAHIRQMGHYELLDREVRDRLVHAVRVFCSTT